MGKKHRSMARNKRKNSNDLKNEAEAKKEEVVQDNVTKIGQNIDTTKNDNEEIDGDTSDSSVYSDLEDDEGSDEEDSSNDESDNSESDNENEKEKEANADEYEYDSSDEEDIRNTVGNIPMHWYDE